MTFLKLLKSALYNNVKLSFTLKYILKHYFSNLLSCFKEVHLFWCVD